MSSNAPRPDDGRARILPFRRRGSPAVRLPPGAEPEPTIEGMEKYAGAGEPDNYRQRMINNGLAFAACVLLVAIGIWIANTMAELRRKQDCVLSGRRDCTPIVVPSAGPTK
jgi:hypothetical protein